MTVVAVMMVMAPVMVVPHARPVIIAIDVTLEVEALHVPMMVMMVMLRAMLVAIAIVIGPGGCGRRRQHGRREPGENGSEDNSGWT